MTGQFGHIANAQQSYTLASRASHRTTKTSQRACLPKRTADCKIDS